MLAMNASPDFRAKVGAATKARWLDPKFRQKQAAGVKAKAFGCDFEIPAWVPIDLIDEYIDRAKVYGEEDAASLVRKLKAEGGTPVPMQRETDETRLAAHFRLSKNQAAVMAAFASGGVFSTGMLAGIINTVQPATVAALICYLRASIAPLRICSSYGIGYWIEGADLATVRKIARGDA